MSPAPTAKEAIIAAPEAAQAPDKLARTLLRRGHTLDVVAVETGLSVTDVQCIAEGVDEPDIAQLVTAMKYRLRDLGMSVLAASKLGKLGRSTLTNLGKGGRVPSDLTLDKLDDLLSWEPGSARSTMFGYEPIPREDPTPARVRPIKNRGKNDYANLISQVEARLRELNMSKSKFARIGGPKRTTLATLGRRGYEATPDTLARIDRYLHWEPGSADLALQGGLPIRQGPVQAPPPSLVSLNAVLDRQRRLLAQLTRNEQGIAQMKAEVEDSINQVNLAIGDMEDTWHRAVITASKRFKG